jgi:hypothetical protein
MCAATGLISAQVVRANYPAFPFRNERLTIRPCPIGDCFAFIHIARQRVGLAGADRRLEDLPYSVVIFCPRSPNQHARDRPIGVKIKLETGLVMRW